MANRSLFQSIRGKLFPRTDAVNEAGGKAYAFGPEHALAQLAATGCLSNTFYATGSTQLDKALELCGEVDSEFLARAAVYARQRAFMKDMPALMLAALAAWGDETSRELLARAFPRVVDNGRMVRNFVQIVRSGVTGRKSLGTGPRRLVRSFLLDHDPGWLFRQSVGREPSLADIVKMVHPRPRTPEQDALFGYLLGKELNGKSEHLPALVRAFEAWKSQRDGTPPKVPFQMLTNQPLTSEQWAVIARHGNWHFTRMNLNTFVRHRVFEVAPELTEVIAERLRDPAIIRKARVFPYQVMMTYGAAVAEVPRRIIDALHDALEVALDNVPAIEGRVLVFPDVSGSMSAPVTGYLRGGTSKVRCIDVAALFSAAILRGNPQARVVPVDTRVHTGYRAEPRDSVLTNARRLAAFGGGGTALSEALAWANRRGLEADAVVMISDYESWADPGRGWSTALMSEWRKLRARNPRAKLICLNIAPYTTTQAPDVGSEILNIGGFSDTCFQVVDAFIKGDPRMWVETIKRTEL